MEQSRSIDSLFASVIAPVTARSFIDEWWERKSLYIAGSPEKFADLGLGRDEFLEIARMSPRSTILTAVSGEQITPISGDQALGLFAAGMTLCLSGLDRLHAMSRRYAVAAKALLGHAGNVSINCYLSPHERGFPAHFDDHSVLILQLAGSKRWHFSATPAAEFPPQSLFASKLADFRQRFPWLPVGDPAQLREETLRPGDALYLPPGSWHVTSASDYSLALTMTFGQLTFQRLAATALDQALHRRAAWRCTLPLETPDATPPSGLSARLQQELAARLRELADAVSGLTSADFVRLWRAAIADFDLPAISSEAPAPLLPTDRIVRDHPIVCVEGDKGGEGRIYLFCLNQTLEVPAEDRFFLERLAACESFVAEEAIQWSDTGEPLPWEDVAEALEQLMLAGFIRKQASSSAQATPH